MNISHIKGAGLVRPEYVFRPTQYIRRFSRINKQPDYASSQLPWGHEIRYRPTDTIGEQIWRVGIFELPICEVLWRLLDEGMNVLDIGANIGQMTSLMAARVGVTGSVTCFEPHPQVFEELSLNVANWNDSPGSAKITPMNMALSNYTGEMQLYLPEEFDGNHGVGSLEADVVASEQKISVTVKTSLLDDLLDTLPTINLIKIDVEGHELKVLEGASRFFETHPATDIIYEDHIAYPSKTALLLQEKGYTILGVDASFTGPNVFRADERPAESLTRDYIATRDLSRCMERLSGKAWQVL